MFGINTARNELVEQLAKGKSEALRLIFSDNEVRLVDNGQGRFVEFAADEGLFHGPPPPFPRKFNARLQFAQGARPKIAARSNRRLPPAYSRAQRINASEVRQKSSTAPMIWMWLCFFGDPRRWKLSIAIGRQISNDAPIRVQLGDESGVAVGCFQPAHVDTAMRAATAWPTARLGTVPARRRRARPGRPHRPVGKPAAG